MMLEASQLCARAGRERLKERRMEAVLATLLVTFDVVGLYVLWKYDRPGIEA
jgi:hypothetical protein